MQADNREGVAAPQHASVIEDLAQQTGVEPAQVRALYEQEFAQLESNAKVRGFLSVLASRNVRLALRQSYGSTT
jgi:Protein of unknown function (DUF3562)